jgi:serine/threonine protein kinase
MEFENTIHSGGQYPTDFARTELKAGDVFDHFELVEFIARGGLGEVWKAVDKNVEKETTTRYVALKFHRHLSSESQSEFLVSQFALAHAIDHPIVNRTLALIPDTNFGPVIVMEYFDGEPMLKFWHRATATMDHAQFLNVGLDLLLKVANALDHLHSQCKLLHQDVKPENILVEKSGSTVKLIDLGSITRIDTLPSRQQARPIFGTIAYSSPERLLGLEQDGRSDLYSLAVLAYELLTGTLPFRCDRVDLLRLQILQDATPKSERLSDQTNLVLERALSKDAKNRQHRCSAFVLDLSEALRNSVNTSTGFEGIASSSLAEPSPSHSISSPTCPQADPDSSSESHPTDLFTHILISLMDLVDECGAEIDFLSAFDGTVVVTSQECEKLVLQYPELGIKVWEKLSRFENCEIIDFDTRASGEDINSILQVMREDGYCVTTIRNSTDWHKVMLNRTAFHAPHEEDHKSTSEIPRTSTTGRQNLNSTEHWHPATVVGRRETDMHVRLFVDTSTLMWESFEKFAKFYFVQWAKTWKEQIESSGQEEHLRIPVVVPLEVVRELETLAEHADAESTRASAKRAIMTLGDLIAKDIVVPFDSSLAYEKQAADDVFLGILPGFLLEHDVILLTQDRLLAQNCQELYQTQMASKAFTGRKRRFAACRLIKDDQKGIRMVNHPKPPSAPTNKDIESESRKGSSKQNLKPSSTSPKKPPKSQTKTAPTQPVVLNRELINLPANISKGTKLTDGTGSWFTIGSQIAIGGEGTIYEIQGQPELLTKIYHANQLVQWRIEKLQRMIANPVRNTGVAWPEALLFTDTSIPVGFLMRRVVGAIPIEEAVYNILDIQKHFPNWQRRELVILARNLALVLRTIHGHNNVVGDLNAANILINIERDLPRVTLVDTDSWQFEGYPSPVSKPAYLHPSLQSKNFIDVKREKKHDEYALAVLIFQILFFGRHPYDSVDGRPEHLTMKSYEFPYPLNNEDNGRLAPRGIPWRIWTHLDYPVQRAFHCVFALRKTVTAEEWVKILDGYMKSIDEDRLDILGNANLIVPEQSRVPKNRAGGDSRTFTCTAPDCHNTETFYNASMISKVENNRRFLCRTCKENEATRKEASNPRICQKCELVFANPIWFEEMLEGTMKLSNLCPTCGGPSPTFHCHDCNKGFSIYQLEKWRILNEKPAFQRRCGKCQHKLRDTPREPEVRRPPVQRRPSPQTPHSPTSQKSSAKGPPPKNQSAATSKKNPQPASPRPPVPPTPPKAPQKSLLGKFWDFLSG